MRPYVDRMKVVFPFEVELYKKEGINVEFVGHPLAENIGTTTSREEFFRQHELVPGKKLLGLFPGSRQQEIEKIFPTMLAAALQLRKELGVQFAVGVASNLNADFLKSFVPGEAPVLLLEHATYYLMGMPMLQLSRRAPQPSKQGGSEPRWPLSTGLPRSPMVSGGRLWEFPISDW